MCDLDDPYQNYTRLMALVWPLILVQVWIRIFFLNLSGWSLGVVHHRRRNHGGSGGWCPPLFSDSYIMLNYTFLNPCLQSPPLSNHLPTLLFTLLLWRPALQCCMGIGSGDKAVLIGGATLCSAGQFFFLSMSIPWKKKKNCWYS